MNKIISLIEVLDDAAKADYNYTEFFAIVGGVFGLVLVCSIVLFWHFHYLKKKDRKNQS